MVLPCIPALSAFDMSIPAALCLSVYMVRIAAQPLAKWYPPSGCLHRGHLALVVWPYRNASLLVYRVPVRSLSTFEISFGRRVTIVINLLLAARSTLCEIDWAAE
eukprot:GHRQ01016910.1.p2 GENE.GHRQ01016910.1~~GHRQ01016910.1.p2  ORF type:complete len:105 (-),score=0.01 GHRQ01016910.1:3-317(-)